MSGKRGKGILCERVSMCKVPEGMKKATTCLGNSELSGPHGG